MAKKVKKVSRQVRKRVVVHETGKLMCPWCRGWINKHVPPLCPECQKPIGKPK